MEKSKEKSDLEQQLIDTLLDRPTDFSLGSCNFRLYPNTLAKTLLLQRHIRSLGFNGVLAKLNPYLEILHIVRSNRERCHYILAVHAMPNTRVSVLNNAAINRQRELFRQELEDDGAATMLLHILTSDRTEALMDYLGIKDERERMKSVLDVKENKGSMTFGGVSIFGSFIGQLKEMGYSDDEILFEHGYSYLRLMLADKVTNIYLTDEELKQLPNNVSKNIINADDPSAIDKLSSMLAGRGLRINK